MDCRRKPRCKPVYINTFFLEVGLSLSLTLFLFLSLIVEIAILSSIYDMLGLVWPSNGLKWICIDSDFWHGQTSGRKEIKGTLTGSGGPKGHIYIFL